MSKANKLLLVFTVALALTLSVIAIASSQRLDVQEMGVTRFADVKVGMRWRWLSSRSRLRIAVGSPNGILSPTLYSWVPASSRIASASSR